jgi:hypothetical protein
MGLGESAEQVDEVSKGLKQRYITKAKKDGKVKKDLSKKYQSDLQRLSKEKEKMTDKIDRFKDETGKQHQGASSKRAALSKGINTRKKNLPDLQRDLSNRSKGIGRATRALPKDEVELDENRLLKVNKLSSVEYQRAKKLKGFDKSKYTWDSKQQLYIKEEVEQIDESKTAKLMALLTALGATYGLEDEARAFADQIQQNIHNAQTAEPNPGRPDPVSKGNMMPGSDRVMRPPVDEIAPAIAAVGRGVAKGVGAVAKGVGSMAKTAGTKMAINKMQDQIADDEANEESIREAVNVQSIKDEVMGAVRSGNPREMKRVSDTIAKRISDLMDLRGTAGKEVDAEIMTALPVLKKAQMMLRDKQKMSEEKTRIDKKCWKGKKIGNPKTKVKGGVRVNNCVPKE